MLNLKLGLSVGIPNVTSLIKPIPELINRPRRYKFINYEVVTPLLLDI